MLIRAPRAIVDGRECAVSVGVRGGRIVSLDAYDAKEVVQLGTDEVLLPGLVDTHVHVNEPGRTEWEGFASATRAAAAGGITTLVDMPLNSIPPTIDVAALDVKRRIAAEKSVVDVGFWGGAIPGNLDQLRPLHDAGVFGFKCFLLHSGVDEFPPLSLPELEKALIEIASFDGLMIVHA
ncbi:MAG: amidohydrolase family protein, partial [Rhodococcus sp. (in: high G+C Gram-positive bacteria)]